jgi:molybdenum cofactor cytidylyltransferase
MHRIGALLLAAGGSRRLGRPKQLLAPGGEPLVHRMARMAMEAGAAPVWVVLGAGAEAVRAAVADLPVCCVDNPGWQEGIASSIRAGVAAAAVSQPAPAALLVLLVDQPRVDPPLLERLIAAQRAAPDQRVACAYGGGLGVPALFPAADFPALGRLRGDRGARDLLRAAPERAIAVPFPGGDVDVDRPEDAAHLG